MNINTIVKKVEKRLTKYYKDNDIEQYMEESFNKGAIQHIIEATNVTDIDTIAALYLSDNYIVDDLSPEEIQHIHDFFFHPCDSKPELTETVAIEEG